MASRLPLRFLLVFLVINGYGHSFAQSPTLKPALTKDQSEQLVQHQSVVADSPVFSGDSFPKVDFLNKELIEAALGTYSLSVRYFDPAWNEVQKPNTPGRYGAWVEIRFANGTMDTRHLTLCKIPLPYQPRKDPFELQVRYPAAFGFRRKCWNVKAGTPGIS